MEREGASSSALRTTLEARASAYGPEDPVMPGLPTGTPGSEPETNFRVGADIQTRPTSFPNTDWMLRALVPRFSGYG